jgi:hypothetical protein
MPEPVSNLLNIFEKTKLDLEKSTSEVPGGPINEPTYGHEQKYGPKAQDQYRLSSEGQIRSDNSNMKNSFDDTNFDLENTNPEGGPINSPQYSHQQSYLPGAGQGFIDKPEGEIRGDNSLLNDKNGSLTELDVAEGSIIADDRYNQIYTPDNPYYTGKEGMIENNVDKWSALEQSTKNTALDIEDRQSGPPDLLGDRSTGTNNEAIDPTGGGPNRITPDMPDGTYKNVNLLSGNTVGGLKQLHKYTPTNPYYTTGEAIPVPPEAPNTGGGEEESISGQLPPSMNPTDYGDTTPNLPELTNPDF